MASESAGKIYRQSGVGERPIRTQIELDGILRTTSPRIPHLMTFQIGNKHLPSEAYESGKKLTLQEKFAPIPGSANDSTSSVTEKVQQSPGMIEVRDPNV